MCECRPASDWLSPLYADWQAQEQAEAHVQAAQAQGSSVEVSSGAPARPAEPAGHAGSRLAAVQESTPSPAAGAAAPGVSTAAGRQQDVETASSSAPKPSSSDGLQHFAGRYGLALLV